MRPDDWRRAVLADAERRGLPELASLIEMLAAATAWLRAADWNERADEPPDASEADA